MVSVSASVNLPLHYKVQKFSSGTGSPGWSWKQGRKMVVMWCGIEIVFILPLFVSMSRFRPHRSTVYIDAAYGYGRDGVVWFVRWYVAIVRPAAKSIEMLLGAHLGGRPKEPCVDGGRDPPCEGQF